MEIRDCRLEMQAGGGFLWETQTVSLLSERCCLVAGFYAMIEFQALLLNIKHLLSGSRVIACLYWSSSVDRISVRNPSWVVVAG